MGIIIEVIKNRGTCDILRNVSRLLSTQALTLLAALAGRSREKDVQQRSNTAAERRLKALHVEGAVDRFILHCGQMQEASWVWVSLHLWVDGKHFHAGSLSLDLLVSVDI